MSDSGTAADLVRRHRRIELRVPWEALTRRLSERSQPHLDPGWIDAVWESNRRLGAPSGLESKVEALKQGDGYVVVTGQQVGLFGGPLYTLYKALTAIELARSLEERTGRTVLPVFWIVGDDSDFGEVSWTWLPTVHGRIQRVRDEAVPTGGTLVGRLPASRQRALRDEFGQVIDGLPHAAEVLRRVDGALERAETWSEAHAAFLHSALGDQSALFVDGADRGLLRTARPFLDSALRTPLEEDLRRGGEALAAAGRSPAFDAELARSSFVLRGDVREPIEDGYADGELLAPNVVLRPILQDALLPNVATVGGPSEIAYRAQLGPLYERLDVPEPIVVPRYRATVVPTLSIDSRAGQPLSDEGDLYGRAVADPRAFVSAAAEDRRPDSLRQGLDEARARVAEELDRLVSTASDFDKNLKQVVESARGKIDYQFGRIADDSVKKARKQLAAENPALLGLEEFIRPKQKPQERVLSWWTPIATDGAEAIETIRRSVAESLRDGGTVPTDGGEPEAESGSLEIGRGAGDAEVGLKAKDSGDELWQLIGLGPASSDSGKE